MDCLHLNQNNNKFCSNCGDHLMHQYKIRAVNADLTDARISLMCEDCGDLKRFKVKPETYIEFLRKQVEKYENELHNQSNETNR